MKPKKLRKKIARTRKKVDRLNKRLDKLVLKQAKQNQPDLAGLDLAGQAN
jgi:hypothetical protein